MAFCSFRGQKIIPVFTVGIEKEYIRDDSGEKLGATFTITINGAVFAYKGSPVYDNGTNQVYFYTGSQYPPDGRTEPTDFYPIAENARLGAILKKINAMKELFAQDGMFEIQGRDGSPPLKMMSRVVSISFEEGPWFDFANYQIILEGERLLHSGDTLGEDNFDFLIKNASESWAWETIEEPESYEEQRHYRLTHTVSAEGKDNYNEMGNLVRKGYEEAKGWVNSKLGFDVNVLINADIDEIDSNYNRYNFIRTNEYNENTGSFSATESWIIAKGPALESYTVNINKNIESNTVVSIQGQIQGLETRNDDMELQITKYDNALSKFHQISGLFYDRVMDAYGGYLHILPLTETVSHNYNGTIDYSYDYNDRPSNLTSAISEVLTINGTFGIDVFGNIPVLGRQVGPVLQNLNMTQAKTKSLTFEAVYPRASGINYDGPLFTAPYSSEIQNIVNQVRPTIGNVFVSNQDYSWNPNIGRFFYSVQWTYSE